MFLSAARIVVFGFGLRVGGGSGGGWERSITKRGCFVLGIICSESDAQVAGVVVDALVVPPVSHSRVR